jgi:hypothetical protein
LRISKSVSQRKDEIRLRPHINNPDIKTNREAFTTLPKAGAKPAGRSAPKSIALKIFSRKFPAKTHVKPQTNLTQTKSIKYKWTLVMRHLLK